MKNLFKSFVVLLAVMAAVPSFAQKANNTLTEKEKETRLDFAVQRERFYRLETM